MTTTTSHHFHEDDFLLGDLRLVVIILEVLDFDGTSLPELLLII